MEPIMEGISIQQAAAQTGLSTHALRYYEQIGLIPPVKRAANGHRRYRVTDLGWVDYVLCLKSVGMPLEDIKRYVTLQSEDDEATLAERVQLLENHRQAIRYQIGELQANLTMIETKIERYRNKLE
jgi:DNA-binding transcriptional MerR regulator